MRGGGGGESNFGQPYAGQSPYPLSYFSSSSNRNYRAWTAQRGLEKIIKISDMKDFFVGIFLELPPLIASDLHFEPQCCFCDFSLHSLEKRAKIPPLMLPRMGMCSSFLPSLLRISLVFSVLSTLPLFPTLRRISEVFEHKPSLSSKLHLAKRTVYLLGREAHKAFELFPL